MKKNKEIKQIMLRIMNIVPYFSHCCYPFLGSHKKKYLKMRKYKKYIKKYSKEIHKIIGARKGMECWKKRTKLVEKVQKCKILKFNSICFTDESPVDK
jgi:hypothetical protein